jgi:hypothetical protein
MKSILYVAATLMVGASIYGFVDYNKTSRQKEFKTMYHEQEVKKPVVVAEKTLPGIVTTETVSTNPLKKSKRKERSIMKVSAGRH